MLPAANLLGEATSPYLMQHAGNPVHWRTWNAEALLKSFEEVRRLEKSGATVICGHDDEQWQSLRKGGAGYE